MNNNPETMTDKNQQDLFLELLNDKDFVEQFFNHSNVKEKMAEIADAIANRVDRISRNIYPR